MLYSQRRSMKSRQPGMVEICFDISGTATTPAASGQDALFVSSVQDLGTGSYKINLKALSLQNLVPKGHACYTDNAVLTVVAVDKQSITVATKVAGSAADANFGLTLNFASEVPYYF